MSKKLITVFGATGAQGGSVIEHLLKDGKWAIRAFTRDPNSKSSQDLKAKGVELVKGDQHNPDDVRAAVKGAYAVFGVTNFWDPASSGKEVELGKKLADIAKEEGVQHLIWSSLSNVEKESKGKWHVPHFTDKAIVQDYIQSIGLNATFVGPAFYYQNFSTFFPPKEENGEVVFTLPKTSSITAFDVRDTGIAVVEALNHPDKYKYVFMPLGAEHGHPQDFIKTYGEVHGKKAKLVEVPLDQFAKFPFPGADELAQMFGWFNDYTYFGSYDRDFCKKHGIKLTSWKDYLLSTKK
eukprot:TRINITY_DN3044_c0_g1_i1.p1 TRINITY_DN3044_c0_g1~~TRINITY_DN3044_c0_g1_i1.p1  ORF type:complete len:309 (-),score=78.54 TRINITY_DN3044_c0_g1_i1:32-913(-)